MPADPGKTERRGGPLLWMVAACLFTSGLASLVLEVVWTRQLRLVFGSTTLAASTILVAYMLGLGLGGIAGGRLSGRIRDGIRAYGWMEIGIGIYALAVPPLLARLPELNRSLLADLDFWPAALGRFAVALAFLLAPTFLMGATLPVLVTAASEIDPRVGRNTSVLYGVNTLGAFVGVLLATFVLFDGFGIAGASRCGALAGVGAGLAALLLVSPAARRLRAGVAAPPAEVRRPSTDAVALGSATPLLLVYACVGFTALVYEVAWTRALAIVLGGSIHAFALMLAAFLAGIGLGSLSVRGWVERTRRPLASFATGVALLGIFAFATTSLLPLLPDVVLWFFERFGVGGGTTVAFQATIAVVWMMPAAVVLGALMPLVARVLAEGFTTAGDAVGRVYFANTIGSACGAFLAGFVLLPSIGLRGTIVLAAAIDLAAAGALLTWLPGARWRAAALAAAALALLVVPAPFDAEALTRGVFRRPAQAMSFGIELEPLEGVDGEEMLYYRDGVSGTVSVHRSSGFTVLKVNGKEDASNGPDMPTQVMLGQVPLLFGRPAESVLVIGLASGTTAGSVATHPSVERIDVVEIEPAMVEASRLFEPANGRPLDDPRVRVILADGRAYLAGTREKYDVIISEPSNPWLTGVSNLFTREFFQAARGALKEDGRLMQWVNLYGMDRRAVASILAALRSEFSHVYGFAHVGNWGDLLLLAMNRPLGRDDLPRWSELPPSVREDLAGIGNFSDFDVWSSLRLLPGDVDRLFGPSDPINTDDNLLVELSTPWLVNSQVFDHRGSSKRSRGALSLLQSVGEPLEAEEVAELAFSYAWLRRDPTMASRVSEAAERRARQATTVAAALAAARVMDPSFAAESQLATLDDAMQRSSDPFYVWLLRAQVHQETGAWAAGLAAAAEALRLRPGDARARVLRARLLAGAEEHAAALEAFEALRAERIGRHDPELERDYARELVAAGRADDALAVLRPLVAAGDPTWPEGWALLARAHAEAGQPEAAAAAKRNHEIASRNHARWAHREALRARFAGAKHEAIALLDMALALAPENAAARRDREALAGERSAAAQPRAP